MTVVGDLKHSRTVHSLVKLLANYRVTLRYVSPASLGMPQEVKDKVAVAGTPQSDHTDLKEVRARWRCVVSAARLFSLRGGSFDFA